MRHTWHGLQVADQAAAVGGAGDLELELGDGFAPRAPGDVCDVGAVAKDRLGDAIKHPRLVAAFDQEASGLRPDHGRER